MLLAIKPVGATGTAAGGSTSTTSADSGTSSWATSVATSRAIWMAPYSWKCVSSTVPFGRPG
jgi:hypothetical protein